MPNDRIVVATVVFAVPEKLVNKIKNRDTLYNIDMLTFVVGNPNYYRSYILNKTLLNIIAILNPTDPDTDMVDLENVDLVTKVAALYQKNPEFDPNVLMDTEV